MKNKEYPIFEIIVFLLLVFSMLIFSWYIIPKYQDTNSRINTGSIVNNLNTGNIKNDNNNLSIEIQTGSEVKTGAKEELTGLVIEKECEVLNSGVYKIITIMSGNNYSPLDPKEYKKYTKLFNVSGEFEEAYGCVVSDLVEYRKKNHVYTYSTYILFNDPEYAGHINGGYSKKNRVIYDWTTSPNERFLNGRFRGDETPKIYTTQEMNLSKLVVADVQNGGRKKINILDRFNIGGPMFIGGFVNAKNGEGILKKFIIAYKCKNGTDCRIK